MNIGIVGSRTRDTAEDLQLVKKAFFKLNIFKGDVIISGGADKGADRFAYSIAKVEGLKLIIHFPKYGQGIPACYFIRNTEIARESDILIACVSDDRTGGTEDTIKKFKSFHPDRELIIC